MDPVTRQPDTLDGPRIQTAWVEHLDAADQRIGLIPTILSGQVEANWDADIKAGCSISLHQPDIDIMKERLRPWIRVNNIAWPLGVFIPTSPTESWDKNGLTWTFQCLDKTAILDDDKMPIAWGYDAGVQVTPQVEWLIQSSGESAISLTESDAVLRTPMSWPSGTSKLTMVNELLNAIGYGPVWVDGYGFYRVEPWVDAQNRTPVRRFEQGQYAIHSPAWTRTQDIAKVPNRVIVRTDGTDDVAGLTATAENLDPSSRYSYQARGFRWKTEVYVEDEATSQSVLDELAWRRLWGWTHPPSHYSVTHAPVPYNLLDVVQFVSNGHDVTVQVNEYQVPLRAGEQMTALWNGIGGA